MNTGDFLTALFKEAGVSIEDSALKDITTKVANTEIADELVSKFNTTYFTEAAAKANPKIIGHFKAQLYNGLDDELKPLYDELEMPDDIKSELHSINSSTKRAAALVRKAKELTEKKATASKGDKAELNQQIEALNNEIKKIKTDSQIEKDNLKKDFDSKVDDLFLSQFLATQNYSSDAMKDLNYMLPKAKIQKALEEKGLKRILEGESFKLQTKDGTDHFENNTKVDFKSFAEKVLADNKFTTISQQPKPGSQQQQIVKGDIPDSKLKGLAQFDAKIQEASTQITL